MEYVDVLQPPDFTPRGIIKERSQAYADGDWLGGFNLWIVQTDPEPAILYQQRSLQSNWEPGKLDVSAGGHLQAGETLYDGLREVQEELGKTYSREEVTYLGRKLHVSTDAQGTRRHNVVEICLVEDNTPLEEFTIQANEVTCLIRCPLHLLLRVHDDPNFSFEASGITANKAFISLQVATDSFPYNWDNYHAKMARLIQRYLKKESDISY